MEGRYPNTLMVVGSHCSDPAREEQFNYWYNHMHVPDWTAPGIFRHGMRFKNTGPEPADVQYLALYESDWDDGARAFESNRSTVRERAGSGRGFPEFRVTVVDIYRRLGGEFRSAIRPVNGILLATLNCVDPVRVGEFNRWYEDVHVADILNTGLFHSAYRYESVSPPNCMPRGSFLSIYETEAKDPNHAGDQLKALRTTWQRQGRLFEAAELVLRITALRLWPRS